MDITQAIAALARRTGQVVTVTASPWPNDAGTVQWIVAVFPRGRACLGSSTVAELAVDDCRAAVDRDDGVPEYPKGKEG